jgi:predicted HD phosphohydrolase
MNDDYFRGHGQSQALMRALLEREAERRAPRFALARREFLGGALGAVAAVSIIEQAPQFRSRAEAQAGYQPPSDDCYAALQADHAKFKAIDASSALDWQLIQAAGAVQQRASSEVLLGMLRVCATLYSGFGVDQLTHMTQTATRARRANASDELILVSLIHDVAKVIGNANHAEMAAALARPFVSNNAYQALRHHMEFQWQHYGDKINQPTDLRKRYVNEPWYADTARFTDEWDQTSFDPKYDTLPLQEFEALLRQFFERSPKLENRTAQDCF